MWLPGGCPGVVVEPARRPCATNFGHSSLEMIATLFWYVLQLLMSLNRR